MHAWYYQDAVLPDTGMMNQARIPGICKVPIVYCVLNLHGRLERTKGLYEYINVLLSEHERWKQP